MAEVDSVFWGSATLTLLWTIPLLLAAYGWHSRLLDTIIALSSLLMSA